MADYMNCPYCDSSQEVDHTDGYGYGEDETYQQTCDDCGKTFVYTTGIIYNHYPERADCLNEGEHDWRPTHTHPKFFTKMRCYMCDEERTPTDEERIEHNLPLTYENK
jgi:hypothetical protein